MIPEVDRPLVAPLQPVQPEHLHVVGEAEPAEVVDRASRHDGDRRAVGQRGDGLEHPGQQLGVVGVGDDRRQHAVDVESDEQRPLERGSVVGDGVRVVERRAVHRDDPLAV